LLNGVSEIVRWIQLAAQDHRGCIERAADSSPIFVSMCRSDTRGQAADALEADGLEHVGECSATARRSVEDAWETWNEDWRNRERNTVNPLSIFNRKMLWIKQ
jgi:hypothetical protein